MWGIEEDKVDENMTLSSLNMWVWWDYVIDFYIRCPMKAKKYNKECVENVIQSLGVFISIIHSNFKAVQDLQVITTLPLVSINLYYCRIYLKVQVIIISWLFQWKHIFGPGLDVKKIEKCMGEPTADAENPILKQDKDAHARIESRCIPFVTFHFIESCDHRSFCYHLFHIC